jgi:hypothetical protein
MSTRGSKAKGSKANKTAPSGLRSKKGSKGKTADLADKPVTAAEERAVKGGAARFDPYKNFKFRV